MESFLSYKRGGEGKGLTELTELELGAGCTEYLLLLGIYKV